MKELLKAAIISIVLKTIGPALAVATALFGYIGTRIVSKTVPLHPPSVTQGEASR